MAAWFLINTLEVLLVVAVLTVISGETAVYIYVHQHDRWATAAQIIHFKISQVVVVVVIWRH